MSKDKKQLDMLHGSLWSKVPVFVLPVAATAVLIFISLLVCPSCTKTTQKTGLAAGTNGIKYCG